MKKYITIAGVLLLTALTGNLSAQGQHLTGVTLATGESMSPEYPGFTPVSQDCEFDQLSLQALIGEALDEASTPGQQLTGIFVLAAFQTDLLPQPQLRAILINVLCGVPA